MDDNKDLLVELDSKAGDGDLGISMSAGFRAVINSDAMEKNNIRKFLMSAGMAVNEASPSSLGTIIFIGMIGGAKRLGDIEEIDARDAGNFFLGSAEAVMEKTGSKPSEKTILDSIIPAAQSLINSEKDLLESFADAYEAARQGMLATKEMKAVHGRAAYYQEKSIGFQDGGATVGMLIFESIYKYLQNQ
ncbi:MAG: dihydroxyacetone kinase subunit L [Clostridia bacterium]|nr:dihydroxyacetone kinase subunit L [Clostridia bacterium]